MKKLKRLLTPCYVSAALLALAGCASQGTTDHTQHNDADKKTAVSSVKPESEMCAGSQLECAKTVTATFDNKGRLWIGYVSDKYLYLQSSTDQGKTFSPAMKVNQVQEAIAARDESRPKISVDKQGAIYLTWTSEIPNAKERHNGNVRFSRSTDGGKTFSEPVTVNEDNQEIGHRFDSLAIGKNGEIFIAWLDARDKVAAKKSNTEYLGSSVYYAWSNDGGKHFQPNKLAAAHSCECCRLQTAIAPDNTPVVVWRHVFEGGIRDHALLKFKDWNTPGDITRISYENWKIDACPHHGTGFSIAEDGRYHAVWFSNSATQQGLFYGYSTEQGKNFSKPINFAKEGAGHPHVLAIGKQVFIVWQQFDGKQTTVLLMKSNDAGKTWGKAETLAKTDKPADQPFLVSDGKSAYLSWKVAAQDYHLQAIK